MEYRENPSTQNPDLIVNKSDQLGRSLNYTLDKQLSLAQKWFPNSIDKERSTELKRLASQEFKIQADMLLVIRESQKRILIEYTTEIEKRGIITLAAGTTALELEAKSELMMMFQKHLTQVTQSLEGFIEHFQNAGHERIRERAEQSFIKAVDDAFDSLDGSLDNFFNQINRTHKNSQK